MPHSSEEYLVFRLVNDSNQPIQGSPNIDFAVVKPTLCSLVNHLHYYPLLFIWFIFHKLRIFRNRDFLLVAHSINGMLIHRSCVFPAFYKFPFMNDMDLQVGEIWTREDHRCCGWATRTMRYILGHHEYRNRVFWYLTKANNIASIELAKRCGYIHFANAYKRKRMCMSFSGKYELFDVPNKLRHVNSIPKRLMDISFSLVGLLFLSPILLYIAYRIRSEDHGPIFYRGLRMGLHGRSFRIYKFRSMVVDAENIGGTSTAIEDSRITIIGRTLRHYKLDELPQLINVLIGNMSLVGPRPEVKQFVDMYTEEEKAILRVRPGITDWASLWNCDEGSVLAGAADPDRAYLELIRPNKIRLQLKYVHGQSFTADLKIILLTIIAVVCPRSRLIRNIRARLSTGRI